MKKAGRILSMLLVFIIMMQFACIAQAASVRPKKVVSIVYDDSGSMNSAEKKWVYANYAMQAFVGLLNKEDTLYLEYMNASDIRKISTTNKDASVNDVRNYFKSDGGTPFEAVGHAYTALESHSKQDNDPNTQYWLVIMTDGQFTSGVSSLAEVEDELAKAENSKLGNGTSPKIIFLPICDTDDKFTPDMGSVSGVDVIPIDKAEDIVGTISDIAAEVSGRYSVDKADVKVIDDHTVEVLSKLPLLSIGILSQYSVATVTKAVANGEGELVVESNVGIKFPEAKAGLETDESLKGNVALINNGSNNIPAGKYTITFSESIDVNNLDIMFEPAIELRLKLTTGGKEISDLTKCKTGLNITAEAHLYEMGTDNLIDLSLLPSGVEYSISHTEDGDLLNTVDTMKMENIILGSKHTTINATCDLPGYFSLRCSVDIDPIYLVVDNVTAEILWDGSERRTYEDPNTGQEVEDGENVVYVSDLKTNKTGVKFILEIDGKPIDKATAEILFDDVKRGIKSSVTPYEIEILDDGSFLVYPSKKSILCPSAVYWLINRGDNVISLDIDGVHAEETINIKLGDPWCLMDMWPWLLILYILLWIFYKPRFGTVPYSIDCRKVKEDRDTGTLVVNQRSVFDSVMVGWFTFSGLLNFLSLGGCQKRVGLYLFKAKRRKLIGRSKVYITGVKNQYTYGKNGGSTKIEDGDMLFSGEIMIGDGRSIYYYKRV